MSLRQAKTNAVTRKSSTAGPRLSQRRAPSAAGVSYIVHDNEATHVVISIAEYEALRAQATPKLSRREAAAERRELLEAERILRDPNTEWFDGRDVAAEFAAREIVRARKKAGLTQQQLADKVGVPQSQIARIEKNPDRTTVRTLKRLAAALKVDVAFLVD